MDKISLTAAIKNWISAHKLPIIIVLVVMVSVSLVVTEKMLEKANYAMS